MADENLMRMQQEAAERVRQMHSRARRFFTDESGSGDHTAPGEVSREIAHTDYDGKKSSSLLSSLGIGAQQDQLLLLLLAVVLAKNDAPIEIIIALMYIAM